MQSYDSSSRPVFFALTFLLLFTDKTAAALLQHLSLISPSLFPAVPLFSILFLVRQTVAAAAAAAAEDRSDTFFFLSARLCTNQHILLYISMGYTMLLTNCVHKEHIVSTTFCDGIQRTLVKGSNFLMRLGNSSADVARVA
jgi:hypothetical protein